MLRRLASAVAKADGVTVDIVDQLEWEYTNQADPFHRRLQDLVECGFDLAVLFGLERRGTAFVRCCSLLEDLKLLGLVDSQGRATPRVELCLRWLAVRLRPNRDSPEDAQPPGLDAAVASWIADAREFAESVLPSDKVVTAFAEPMSASDLQESVPRLIWLTLATALSGNLRVPDRSAATWQSLTHVKVADSADAQRTIGDWIGADGSPFRYMCRLVPALHVLVRAYWTTPLRWFFVPLSSVASSSGERGEEARINSGLIVMVEDDVRSLAYGYRAASRITPGPKDSQIEGGEGDVVLHRLRSALPVLSSVAQIEGACLQEQVVWRFLAWETNRYRLAQVAHQLRDMRRELQHFRTAEAEDIRAHLALLEQQFQARLAPPPDGLTPTRRAVRIDGVEVCRAAVAFFNRTFWGRRYGKVSFLPPEEDTPAIAVNPFEDSYRDGEVLAEQANAALQNLLLDAITQRARHTQKRGLELAVSVIAPSRRVQFEIRTPSAIRAVQWAYPDAELSSLPRGRGFHNLFANAIGLGAVAAGVANDADRGGGRIWLAFEPHESLGVEE